MNVNAWLDRAVVVVAVAGAMWLIAAGILKLEEVSAFEASLVEHGIMPERLIPHIAVALPWIEVAIGALAIYLVAMQLNGVIALRLVAAMFVVFSAYAWIAHFAGASGKAGCGCGFRSGQLESWLPLAWENSGISIAATLVSFAPRMAKGLAR